MSKMGGFLKKMGISSDSQIGLKQNQSSDLSQFAIPSQWLDKNEEEAIKQRR